jgi:hypothetical protein
MQAQVNLIYWSCGVYPHQKFTQLQEQLKMAKSKTAGSRSEFVDAWKKWARAINNLAYQSDNNATIMTAVELRIQMLALIDEITDEIYPVGDVPDDDFDMMPFSPFSRAKETDDQSAD